MANQKKTLMKLGQHTQLNNALSAIHSPKTITKKLQMNIPEELHKKFKLACLNQDVDMTEVVIELVKVWLSKNNYEMNK